MIFQIFFVIETNEGSSGVPAWRRHHPCDIFLTMAHDILFQSMPLGDQGRLNPGAHAQFRQNVRHMGSGGPAIQINSSTRGGFFMAPRSAGPQAGGGNYNVWGDTSSGLRYDAFLVYAGLDCCQVYEDKLSERGLDPNPSFPTSAPFVWIVTELDATLEQNMAYGYANQIWRALDRLGRGAEVNDLFRIYSLPGATHLPRDFYFSAFDSPRDREGLWYDYADILPNPGAFNERGKGLRTSDWLLPLLLFNGPLDDWDFDHHGAARLPRDTPLLLQTLSNLRLNSERGVPLPISRVDAKTFESIQEIETEACTDALAGSILPRYSLIDFPWPDPWDEEAFLATVHEISHSIEVDTGIVNDFGDPPRPLTWEEARNFCVFLENPLERSIQPIVLPDSLPLGTNFYFFDLVFEAPFAKQEFRDRYRNPLGYVAAFTKATFDLMKDRLWDPQLGTEHIFEALRTKPVFATKTHETTARPEPAPLQKRPSISAPPVHGQPAMFRELEGRSRWKRVLKP